MFTVLKGMVFFYIYVQIPSIIYALFYDTCKQNNIFKQMCFSVLLLRNLV